MAATSGGDGTPGTDLWLPEERIQWTQRIRGGGGGGGPSLTWKAVGEAWEPRAGGATNPEPGAGVQWFSRHWQLPSLSPRSLAPMELARQEKQLLEK